MQVKSTAAIDIFNAVFDKSLAMVKVCPRGSA
jgi:hypothetical protein